MRPDEVAFVDRARKLGEPGLVRGLVQAAGFADPRESALTVDWGFASFDLLWRHRADAIARLPRPPSAGEIERYRAGLAEVARAWTRPDGSLRYPLHALAVVA
jgi:hypothetical protein